MFRILGWGIVAEALGTPTRLPSVRTALCATKPMIYPAPGITSQIKNEVGRWKASWRMSAAAISTPWSGSEWRP